jgi:hypothetical protein
MCLTVTLSILCQCMSYWSLCFVVVFVFWTVFSAFAKPVLKGTATLPIVTLSHFDCPTSQSAHVEANPFSPEYMWIPTACIPTSSVHDIQVAPISAILLQP